MYEGKDVDSFIQDFHESVDFYTETCLQTNNSPEKPYKGTFNFRISPDLHRKAAIFALNNKISLNSFVEKAIANMLQS